jgi:hypothetical protein
MSSTPSSTIPRSGPWTASQVREFLSEARIPMRIAANTDSGFPVVLSLWFLAEGDEIFGAVHRDARIAQRLRADPRCAFEIAPNDHPDLRELPFPMLADTKRDLASELGILHKDVGVCLRATYIVDPEGVIRFVSVNDLSVGRNVDEVLRVLDALQTGELTACGWNPGEPTLDAA